MLKKRFSASILLCAGLLFAVTGFGFIHQAKLPKNFSVWNGKTKITLSNDYQLFLAKHGRHKGWIHTNLVRVAVRCSKATCKNKKDFDELEFITYGNNRVLIHSRPFVQAYLSKYPNIIAIKQQAFGAKVDNLPWNYLKNVGLDEIYMYGSLDKITKIALPTDFMNMLNQNPGHVLNTPQHRQ